MTSYSLDDRIKENRQAWREYCKGFTIEKFVNLLAIIAFLVIIFGYINQHGGTLNLTNIFADFYANVSSELLSIIITVAILERLNSKQQDKKELIRLKALLASNESVVTKIAIAELRAKGWLYDGSLNNTNLLGASLETSDLWKVNITNSYLHSIELGGSILEMANFTGSDMTLAKLPNTNLMGANLKNTNLGSSVLYQANMIDSNLENANLSRANLQEANLYQSKFEGVILEKANLKGANLEKANLENLNLRKTNFSCANLKGTCLKNADLLEAHLQGTYLEGSIFENTNLYGAFLPDGTVWKPNVDMRRFTDKEHPDYKSSLIKINEIRKERGYSVSRERLRD